MNKILEEVSNKFTAFPVTLERWGLFLLFIGLGGVDRVDREGEGKIKV